jgi:hypothetical protein
MFPITWIIFSLHYMWNWLYAVSTYLSVQIGIVFAILWASSNC